jgi:hypothetical protein
MTVFVRLIYLFLIIFLICEKRVLIKLCTDYICSFYYFVLNIAEILLVDAKQQSINHFFLGGGERGEGFKLDFPSHLFTSIFFLVNFYLLNFMPLYMVVLVFTTTFNNNSVISWQLVFIGRGNQSTLRKPPTCSKSLTNFII